MPNTPVDTPTADEMRYIFDTYEKVIRKAVLAAHGNPDTITELANGYQTEFERITNLYSKADENTKFIYQTFTKQSLTAELNSALCESDLMHLAWQTELDSKNRGLLIEYQGRYIEGPVATRLADALLMAIKMPKLASNAKDGLWIDAGSGTGMAAIALAACGRNTVGIEKIPPNVLLAQKNQYELQELTGKTFPVEFILGKLPEAPLDTVNPHIQEIFNKASVWYCYPWPHDFDDGVQLTRVELFKQFAKQDAHLILYTAVNPATFTIDDIRRKGLRPIELSEGRFLEGLAYPDVFRWSVWEK